MGGDLVLSHLVATLSCVFPEGEDFFVRSVRHYRDRVDDPVLKAQVAGFIGQEATHGREHRNLNRRLGELGYPTRHLDKRTKVWLALVERLLPPAYRLAITAALEHYTATLAEVLLTSAEAQALFEPDELRSMVLWHSLEEAEHKAVAFDVYATVCGNERVRVWVMRLTTVAGSLDVLSGVVTSLMLDPAARDLGRLWRSIRGLRQTPFSGNGLVRRIGEYNRREFHPNDRDLSALIGRWQVELFG